MKTLRSNEEKLRDYLSSIEIDESSMAGMNKFTRILCISPHPDDAEIMAGGYIAGRTREGSKIKLIVVSDGRKGSLTKENEENMVIIRKHEQEEAAKLLGIDEVEFMGFRDSEIPDPRIIRDALMPIVRDFAPDLVVTVDPNLPYEAHIDHINVGKAVMEAVLLYSHPTIGRGNVKGERPVLALGATSNPNVLVNIDNFFDTKMRSIEAHKSQMDSTGYVIEAMKKMMSLYGTVAGCKYGEPFLLLHPESMHMNPLAKYL